MGYAITNRSYLRESPAEALKRMRTTAIKAGTYIPKIGYMEVGTGFTAKRKHETGEERFLILSSGVPIDVDGNACEPDTIDASSVHNITLPD